MVKQAKNKERIFGKSFIKKTPLVQMNKKKHLCFILPYREGGVASIVRNIIQYIDKTDLYIQVILVKNLKDPQAFNPNNINADNITVFEYLSVENKYSVYKRFSRLISKNSIIIANDFFEIKAINTIKLKNKIIRIVHDSHTDYFNQIKYYSGITDTIIGVSEYITNTISVVLNRKSSILKYICQPVPNNSLSRKINLIDKVKIIFVGRFVDRKGIYNLPVIDKMLKQNGIEAKWTIVGFGPEENKFKNLWSYNSEVVWTGKISNSEVLSLYPQNDLFILPTFHSEGFPVVLIEAMKAGLVPLTSNISSGIPEVVKKNVTGYLFPINRPDLYAEKIEFLNNNRKKLEELSKKALQIVNDNFDPYIQAAKYKVLIDKIINDPNKKKKFVKEKFGILDKPFFPNFVVKKLRKLITSR